MKTMYKIKSIFTVKQTRESDQFLAEFENDEIVTDDKHDHDAWFGHAHKLARDFVKEHGGVIERTVTCSFTQVDYSEDGNLYI